MATATTSTSNSKVESAASFVAETTKQNAEQLFNIVRQSASLWIDAASAWLKTVTTVGPPVPALSLLPVRSTMQQMVAAGFDTADSLLTLQRDLAGQFVALLPSGA
jgi:hypothetical protein